MLTTLDDADARAAGPIGVSTSRGSGSPSWASSVTSAPVISRPRGQRAPERRVRAPRARRAALARRSRCPTRTSRGSRGSGSCPGTAARRRRRPCGPSSAAAAAARRGTSRAVDDEPAADPGAERQHDRVAAPRAPRRAGARRASPRCASLSTATGRPRRSAIRSRNGRPRAAGGWIQRDAASRGRPGTGSPKPDRLRPRRRRLARLLDRLDQLVEQRAGVLRARQAVDPVAHRELRVDHPGEQLRARPGRRRSRSRRPWPATIHGGWRTPRRPDGLREYKLYRSRAAACSRGAAADATARRRRSGASAAARRAAAAPAAVTAGPASRQVARRWRSSAGSASRSCSS